MDIKCHECGAHINLDESLKNSLLDKEKEALKAQMLEAQEIELANQRAEYKKLLEAKSLALSENYQKEIEAGDHHDPSPLELYCDANPSEPECLVYED